MDNYFLHQNNSVAQNVENYFVHLYISVALFVDTTIGGQNLYVLEPSCAAAQATSW